MFELLSYEVRIMCTGSQCEMYCPTAAPIWYEIWFRFCNNSGNIDVMNVGNIDCLDSGGRKLLTTLYKQAIDNNLRAGSE